MSEKDEVEKRDSQAAKWETIQRRMEAVQRVLEHGHMPTPEQEQAILKARAKAMAQEPLRAQRDLPELGPDLEIVTFRLAHETYGFESRYIREVYPLKELCPLPCTPSFVLGLVNVRGQLLSVLDLRRLFGLASKELDNHNHAIILHHETLPHETMEFGILADTLLGVYSIAARSLQPALPTLTGIRHEFLLGITPQQVIVLDAAKLLSSRDILVYEEVET